MWGLEAPLSQLNDLCLLYKLWCFTGIKHCSIKSANKDEQRNLILLSGSFSVQSCKVPSIDFGQCASDWEQATSSKARWENEMVIESSDSAFSIFGNRFLLWDSKNPVDLDFLYCALFFHKEKIALIFSFLWPDCKVDMQINWISYQRLHFHIYCSFLLWYFPEK